MISLDRKPNRFIPAMCFVAGMSLTALGAVDLTQTPDLDSVKACTNGTQTEVAYDYCIKRNAHMRWGVEWATSLRWKPLAVGLATVALGGYKMLD